VPVLFGRHIKNETGESMAEKTREQWQKEWEEYLEGREKNYTSELVSLTHDEAIAAMKAGENLVNGIDRYGIAHYHWHEEPILDKAYFLKSDSYYDLAGDGDIIPENELPQLYRIVTQKKESNGKDND
jgi:hypothetical protein